MENIFNWWTMAGAEAKFDKVALRYGKAAYDFLGNPQKGLSVSSEMDAFAKVLEENTELRAALTNEAFPTPERLEVLKDVSKKLGLSEEATKVLCVLTENRRILSAAGVARRIHLMCLEAADVAALDVESPEALSDSDKKKIEEKFSKILGKKVEAQYRTDKNLLGGLRVTAGGRTYNGTLSGWLDKMEEKLMGGYL